MCAGQTSRGSAIQTARAHVPAHAPTHTTAPPAGGMPGVHARPLYFFLVGGVVVVVGAGVGTGSVTSVALYSTRVPG